MTLGLRLWAAWFANPVRDDGAYFILSAQLLASGQGAAAQAGLGPNLYVAILTALHAAGLDYETAGKGWGIFVSTLTLLPLIGWARLQFGERISWLTGFLYAVHPRFIEWAPEVLRDPTFWLCCAVTLYAFKRAQLARSNGWMMLAAVAILCGVHLRLEGWLLLLPYVVYVGVIWLAARVEQSGIEESAAWRWLRTALWAAAPLVAIVVLNATLLRETPLWGRIAQLAASVQRKWTEAPAPQAALAVAKAEPRRDMPRQIAHFLKKLVKGVDPWFGIPLLIGLVRLRRRVLRRPELLSLVSVGIAAIGLTFAYLLYFGEISSRYFLLPTMLGLPFAAYGWIVVINCVKRFLPALAIKPKPALAAVTACTLLVLAALTPASIERAHLARDAAFGRAILAACGPDAPVAVWQKNRMLAYYGQCNQAILPADEESWLADLRREQPAFVLADMELTTGPAFAAWIASHPELGYRPLLTDQTADGVGRVLYTRQGAMVTGKPALPPH